MRQRREPELEGRERGQGGRELCDQRAECAKGRLRRVRLR